MSTPWDRAKQQRYVDQERRTAAKKGARPQANSGRRWTNLRDVIQESPIAHLLIDNKTTEDFSYRLAQDDWHRLKRDANRTPPGCAPALQIDIRELRLLVIEEPFWDDVLDYIRVLEDALRDHDAPESVQPD